MTDFMDLMPNPDEVGESLYRSLHEELNDWFLSMTEDDPVEVALSFAADLRDNATRIEQIANTLKENNNADNR